MYVFNYGEKSENKVQYNNVKRNKCVMCGSYPCLKLLKIGVRCCFRTNSVIVDMDVYQNIIVPGTLNIKDNVKYARKKSGLDGFKPKKVSKQDNGKGHNKPITNTCKEIQSLSCASLRFRSDAFSIGVVPV